eukprot:2132220-Pyramimonas_sp.AAC.1
MGVPRAFSLKLRNITHDLALEATSFDVGFETSDSPLTAKHADGMNMTGKEEMIDRYLKYVEH